MNKSLSDSMGLLKKISDPLICAINNASLKESMPVHDISRSNYSHLEAVARLFCGASSFLEQYQDYAKEHLNLPSSMSIIFNSILSPDSRDALNFSEGRQPLVDAAFLAVALLRAPKVLWEGLDKSTQEKLVDALYATRRVQPNFNNWLLFSAVIEAFFLKCGLEWDAMRVDCALRLHEQWYLGDGIYGDGPELHLDYYNSFVIQPLLLEVLWAVHGQHQGWDRMYNKVLARAQRHSIQLERMIGPDGSFPPLGRSLAYRCGAFHLLALLSWKKLLPSSLRPAQVRCALMAVIDKTLGSPSNYDDQGWLRVGINGSQPSIGEGYISTGSLYLCSTAFLPLGLSEADAFWSEPDEPWTQRRLWLWSDDILIDKAFR